MGVGAEWRMTGRGEWVFPFRLLVYKHCKYQGTWHRLKDGTWDRDL